MADRIGVGIIGASAERGWAQAAHIPALRALREYEIRAVSTTSKETALRSAEAYGVSLAFDNHDELLARPEVDLAVVAVNVMHHREITLAAIAAKKMVFCEWPLGRNLSEANEIATAARNQGVKTIVGLQGRFGPAVRYVRELVKRGHIGALLGAAIRGSAPHEVWRGILDRPYEFHADPANGANLLSIPAGHALDMLTFVVGEFESVSSTMIVGRKSALRLRDKIQIPTTAKDPIAITGVLRAGGLASVYYHGGASAGPDFVWEINGTEGNLILYGEDGFANMADLSISSNRHDQPARKLSIPEEYRLAPRDLHSPADNVAAIYVQFARDLKQGRNDAPDFEAGLRLHRLIDAIERSNDLGVRRPHLKFAKLFDSRTVI